mmetsp:Transcript_49481/g.116157  ORF Transcript_49481/g.116157 Transcript_49481/m.116157 type:complete len:124 (-) Transcript_49481:264-635(-)
MLSFEGGPCQKQFVTLVHNVPTSRHSLAVPCADGGTLWVTRQEDAPHLFRKARERVSQGHSARVGMFAGHAQWKRDQLHNEIARGDWGVCPARDIDFTQDPLTLFAAVTEAGRPLYPTVPAAS